MISTNMKVQMKRLSSIVEYPTRLLHYTRFLLILELE
jgi:hypothetical protein